MGYAKTLKDGRLDEIDDHLRRAVRYSNGFGPLGERILSHKVESVAFRLGHRNVFNNVHVPSLKRPETSLVVGFIWAFFMGTSMPTEQLWQA